MHNATWTATIPRRVFVSRSDLRALNISSVLEGSSTFRFACSMGTGAGIATRMRHRHH
jgi:hypothetical protein